MSYFISISCDGSKDIWRDMALKRPNLARNGLKNFGPSGHSLILTSKSDIQMLLWTTFFRTSTSLRRPLGPKNQLQQDLKHSKMDVTMTMEMDMGIANVLFHQHFLWRFQRHLARHGFKEFWPLGHSLMTSKSNIQMLLWTTFFQTSTSLRRPLSPKNQLQ